MAAFSFWDYLKGIETAISSWSANAPSTFWDYLKGIETGYTFNVGLFDPWFWDYLKGIETPSCYKRASGSGPRFETT